MTTQLTHRERKHKRVFGEFLTPRDLACRYILPEIIPLITQYRWVDLFAGNGNLIFPIVESVPTKDRAEFFLEHVRLYDIQEEMVERCVQKAISLGIPEEIARQNIKQRDTLGDYPEEIFDGPLPVYHITNPPYLYLGYIAKHRETQLYLKYFSGENEGYQDLYQIALANDRKKGVSRMAYIIPTNFLFGASGANKIRQDLLYDYWIRKVYVFEKSLFEHTGIHVMIAFFERKPQPNHSPQTFEFTKVSENLTTSRRYTLSFSLKYRAGSDFKDFVQNFRAKIPLRASYYLMREEVEAHPGSFPLKLLDANGYSFREGYRILDVQVDRQLYERIKANPLFIRTLDTGSDSGRAGLHVIPEEFGVDGIMVTTAPYRTHPIQVFIDPPLSPKELLLLKAYFNLILEHFRKLTDSEFMTTFKYSSGTYTRKYLGLSQARALIETFPYLELPREWKEGFEFLVRAGKAEQVIDFLKRWRDEERGGKRKRLVVQGGLF